MLSFSIAAAAELMNPSSLEAQQLLAMQAAALGGMMIDPSTGLPAAYSALGAASAVPAGFSPGMLPGNMSKTLSD